MKLVLFISMTMMSWTIYGQIPSTSIEVSAVFYQPVENVGIFLNGGEKEVGELDNLFSKLTFLQPLLNDGSLTYQSFLGSEQKKMIPATSWNLDSMRIEYIISVKQEENVSYFIRFVYSYEGSDYIKPINVNNYEKEGGSVSDQAKYLNFCTYFTLSGANRLLAPEAEIRENELMKNFYLKYPEKGFLMYEFFDYLSSLSAVDNVKLLTFINQK